MRNKKVSSNDLGFVGQSTFNYQCVEFEEQERKKGEKGLIHI